MLRDIDKISLNTLRNCMQTVFEDGPKRDRRLWLGDFRLQALVNYHSFKNYDLCKRCLYLFAGTVNENGLVPSCVYERPIPCSGELFIYDYTALFPVILLEYAEASGDLRTAVDLLPIALRQLDIILKDVDDKGVFRDNNKWWLFIDWNSSLDKQSAEQGVVIFCLKRALRLLEMVGDVTNQARLQRQISLMSKAAIRELYDPDRKFFVSGPDKQISWASHAWLTLAEVIDQETARSMFSRLDKCKDAIQPSGPYLYHYIIESMMAIGLEQKAFDILEKYWGEMVKCGCDTFWEVFDSENLNQSPYGYVKMNSFCHAWSCTPAYFLRRKFLS
jgi:hypothetical protein